MTRLNSKGKNIFDRLVKGEKLTVDIKHGTATMSYQEFCDFHTLRTKFNYGGSGFGETTEIPYTLNQLKILVNSFFSQESIKAYGFDPNPRFL